MIISIISLCVAAAALLLSYYTYITHDKELKNQAKLINSYQIEKIELEKEESKKAVIEASVTSEDKDGIIINVSNKGKSKAKNVQVIFPENDSICIIENPLMVVLKPQNSFKIKMHLSSSYPDTLDITFRWEDDYNKDNKDHQIIQLR